MTRPPALMVAPAMPARTGNGRAMRLGLFLEALATVAEVDLLVVGEETRGDPDDALPRSIGASVLSLPSSGGVDSAYGLLARLRDETARLAAFRAYGRPSAAAALTLPLQGEIAARARERGYRLVHVGRAFMIEGGIAATGAGGETPVLTLDLDEDDFVSCATMAEEAGESTPKALWWRAEGEAIDRLIARHGARFARSFMAGEPDRETLRKRHPGLDPVLVPNAVAVPATLPPRPAGGPLLFVGTMSYAPNSAGMRWFASEVLPRLSATVGARIVVEIAGAGTPRELRVTPGIRALGFVEDLAHCYGRAGLVVAPLFSGRGTRIKLLEAAAQGVPIVATPVAVQGLPLEDGESAWIAEDAEGFARACAEALADPAEAERRAAAARALVAEGFDRAAIIRRLASSFSELLV